MITLVGGSTAGLYTSGGGGGGGKLFGDIAFAGGTLRPTLALPMDPNLFPAVPAACFGADATRGPSFPDVSRPSPSPPCNPQPKDVEMPISAAAMHESGELAALEEGGTGDVLQGV